MGDVSRAGDLLREHRGDSHVVSSAVGGADAMEILLAAVPPRSAPETWRHAGSYPNRKAAISAAYGEENQR
jgi:hypothetical protein